MAISVTEPQIGKFWQVVYTFPNKKGILTKGITDYCENVEKMRKRVEKDGGEILAVNGPFEKEIFGVNF